MRWIYGFLFAAALGAADGSLIFYSKTFPGSVPPYVAIVVERSGKAEYKEAPDDDRPLKFKLQESETSEIFALAEKLERFRRPLESGLKVANTGIKLFRWEDGAQKNEVKFNYSLDLDAQALADWFERMAETEQHVINLERAVRFDKLGVQKVLLHIQAAMDRNRLVALEQFLPMLDRVVKNESYLNMSRERAAGMAEFIRSVRSRAE